MRINTRFTVAVHILALIALNDADPATSEMMAMSCSSGYVLSQKSGIDHNAERPARWTIGKTTGRNQFMRSIPGGEKIK